MEKRLFVAVLLSIAFLFGWAWLAPKLFPQLRRPATPVATDGATKTDSVAKPDTTASPAASAGTTAETPVPAEAASQPAVSAEQRIETVIETPGYRARFSNEGAQLVSLQLKEYKEKDGTQVDLVRARGADRDDFPFAVRGEDPQWNDRINNALYTVDVQRDRGRQRLVYRFSDGRTTVTKTFDFTNEFPFTFRVEVLGLSSPYRIEFGPGIKSLAPDEKETQFVTTGNGLIQQADDVDVIRRDKASSFVTFDPPVRLVGLEDNFFLAILRPDRHNGAIVRSVDFPPATEDAKPRKEIYIGLNSKSGVVSGTAFFGPKKADLLEKHGLGDTINFGVFGFIARILLSALLWIHTWVNNYGWAIVVLTAIIKVILYPLQHKSIVSMKKMQKLQPKMNAIKERYKKAKTDPEQRQKMNADMMKLYQQEGINPMSGCLPILLQLPILWAFYSMLSSAIELRGAEFFGWITDLSAKDPYYITPILMTVTMYIQQKMTPTTADPVQKRIFMAMPFIFGFIFKDLPSGLVLYWLVQNVLTIAQQGIMNKYWKDHPDEVAR